QEISNLHQSSLFLLTTHTFLYYQVLNFGMIVSSALMIWKGLMVVTGSESPIVVVLSGSMEPAFHRGDLLFLTNRVEDPIRVGEIVVFRIEGREIPIVHRVLKIHEKENGDVKFLTKGDNNSVDDRGLYKQGQHWLEKKDVVGRARGFVPYIGIVTILMNDYPKFKVCNESCLNYEKLLHRSCSNTCALFPDSMLYCVCSGCLFWYTENEEF
uniref:Signal peptidase complex catalytic subunit SEC11 n=1 Tax=Sinocyclocheilus grahami TaxID=75366 RepID=A0A672QKZ7_SINGR